MRCGFSCWTVHLLEDLALFKVSTRLNFDLNENTDKRQQSCSLRRDYHDTTSN